MSRSSRALPAFVERPAAHVHIIYLRESLPSQEVLTLMRRVIEDHGLKVTQTQLDKGIIVAEAKGGDVEKKEVTVRTGRHAIKGNMIIMEYNKFIGEQVAVVLAGIAIALVLVVVVVAIAGAAGGNHSHSHSGGGSSGGSHHHHSGGSSSGSSGGGGHHHHHHHHHHSSGYTSGFFDGWVYSSIAPRAAPSTTVIVQTTTNAPAELVRKASSFKTRSEFFEYFYENCTRFFFNYALTRVPDEMSKSMKAVPLLQGEVKEGTIPFLGSDAFCVRVPAFEGEPIPPTLRIDLIGDGFAKIYCKHESMPSRFSKKTASSVETGKYSYTVSVGPSTSPSIKPGLWYITILNKNSISELKYKIGWMLFEDTDKVQTNTTLFGSSQITTVDEEGEEWEVVDYTPAQASSASGGKGKGKSKDMMSLHTIEDALQERTPFTPVGYFPSGGVVPGPADPLTQGTDLLSVPESRLKAELAIRGLPATSTVKRELCAALWPHLPPADGSASAAAPPPPASAAAAGSAAVPSAPSPDSEEEEDDVSSAAAGELEFDAPVPHAFICPITCEIMLDPVMCSDGFSYDRTGIQRWLSGSALSPMTGLKLESTAVTPNIALKTVITEWVSTHKKK